MKTIPAIDSFFNLEEALKADGYDIYEKDLGVCIARFNQVYIEFNQAFISDSPFDMKVFRYVSKDFEIMQETIFVGVAPTNQHDYDVLMELLFPSDEFKSRLYSKYIENQ